MDGRGEAFFFLGFVVEMGRDFVIGTPLMPSINLKDFCDDDDDGDDDDGDEGRLLLLVRNNPRLPILGSMIPCSAVASRRISSTRDWEAVQISCQMERRGE